jgi:hypothetical protein
MSSLPNKRPKLGEIDLTPAIRTEDHEVGPSVTPELSFLLLGSPNVEVFEESYLRNSKSSRQGGHKNLRCFPHCANRVHVKRGFCGSSLHAVVRHSSEKISACFGHFQSIPASDYYYEVGDTVDLTRMHQDCESSPPLWWKGAPIASTEAEGLAFELNGGRKGWHCGLQSCKANKFAFVVHFCAEVGNTTKVVAILNSRLFKISSQRRAVKTNQPGAVGNAVAMPDYVGTPCTHGASGTEEEWVAILRGLKGLPCNNGKLIQQRIRSAIRICKHPHIQALLHHALSFYKCNAAGKTQKLAIAVIDSVNGDAEGVADDTKHADGAACGPGPCADPAGSRSDGDSTTGCSGDDSTAGFSSGFETDPLNFSSDPLGVRIIDGEVAAGGADYEGLSYEDFDSDFLDCLDGVGVAGDCRTQDESVGVSGDSPTLDESAFGDVTTAVSGDDFMGWEAGRIVSDERVVDWSGKEFRNDATGSAVSCPNENIGVQEKRVERGADTLLQESMVATAVPRTVQSSTKSQSGRQGLWIHRTRRSKPKPSKSSLPGLAICEAFQASLPSQSADAVAVWAWQQDAKLQCRAFDANWSLFKRGAFDSNWNKSVRRRELRLKLNQSSKVKYWPDDLKGPPEPMALTRSGLRKKQNSFMSCGISGAIHLLRQTKPGHGRSSAASPVTAVSPDAPLRVPTAYPDLASLPVALPVATESRGGDIQGQERKLRNRQSRGKEHTSDHMHFQPTLVMNMRRLSIRTESAAAILSWKHRLSSVSKVHVSNGADSGITAVCTQAEDARVEGSGDMYQSNVDGQYQVREYRSQYEDSGYQTSDYQCDDYRSVYGA